MRIGGSAWALAPEFTPIRERRRTELAQGLQTEPEKDNLKRSEFDQDWLRKGKYRRKAESGRYSADHRRRLSLILEETSLGSSLFHTLSRDGMEWLLSVMIDIPMNQIRGDPLARHERRLRKEGAAQAKQ